MWMKCPGHFNKLPKSCRRLLFQETQRYSTDVAMPKLLASGSSEFSHQTAVHSFDDIIFVKLGFWYLL